MSAKQLIVQAHEGGQKTIDFVDSQQDAYPEDYEDLRAGRSVPTLGTQGLLELAVALYAAGYRISEIDIRDSNFEPLDESSDEEFQLFLQDRIRRGGMDEASIAQIVTGSGLVVVSLTVQVPGTPHQITINRDGELRAREGSDWETLVGDVGLALGYRHSA